MTHKHSSTIRERAQNRSPFDSFLSDDNFALMMLIVTTNIYLFTMICFVQSSGKQGRAAIVVILKDCCDTGLSETPTSEVPTSTGAC